LAENIFKASARYVQNIGLFCLSEDIRDMHLIHSRLCKEKMSVQGLRDMTSRGKTGDQAPIIPHSINSQKTEFITVHSNLPVNSADEKIYL
jgi:hypothetical protein